MDFSVFYPKNEDKEWKKLLRSDLFIKIYDYISQNQNCILREIKLAVPEKEMERTLDKMIELKIVSRVNRRYEILLKPVSKWEVDVSLAEFDKEKFTKDEWTQGLFAFLQKHLLAFDSPVFVAKDSELEQGIMALPTAQSLVAQGGRLEFAAFSDFGRGANSLENYFEKLDKGAELTAEQAEVYELLGDVSLDYTLKTFGVWLLRFMNREVIKSRRKDIFLSALLKFQMMKEIEEGQYGLNLPFLEENERIGEVLVYLEGFCVGKSTLESLELVRQMMDVLEGNFYPQFLRILD